MRFNQGRIETFITLKSDQRMLEGLLTALAPPWVELHRLASKARLHFEVSVGAIARIARDKPVLCRMVVPCSHRGCLPKLEAILDLAWS